MNKNRYSKGKIDARGNFLDILSSTEKANNNDYMLHFLVNKTKEDFKRQVKYANTKNLFLDSDIYSKNIRKGHKTKTTKIMNNKKPLKRNSIQNKITSFWKKSFSIGNINMFQNKIHLKLDSNKNINSINIKKNLEQEEEKEKDKEKDKDDDYILFSEINTTERKRFEKLENLISILELVDIHEKTTQNQIVDENEKKRLNMQRNKSKNQLYHTSLTYDKNNLFFNKKCKYKLIFDKNKNINDIYVHTQKNNTNKSTTLNKRKNRNDINNINNINTLITELKLDNNNKPLSSARTQRPLSVFSNQTDKIEPNNNRNKILILDNTETREVTPFTNPYTTFSESNIFKTYNNSNNSKNKIFKADLILNGKKNQNKKISKVYSDIYFNYKKIKDELNNYYFTERKEQKENKKIVNNIKNLIKKRKTNIRLLVKELNLDYDQDKEKVNLEEIITNKRNKLKERMKSKFQRQLLNQIQQQVLNEDKILSKKILLETNIEKKLNSRKKKLNEKMFEELTLKRKQIKNHIIGFKLKYEKDYINKLMKDDILNFNVPKSLEALLHKYKIMKFN